MVSTDGAVLTFAMQLLAYPVFAAVLVLVWVPGPCFSFHQLYKVCEVCQTLRPEKLPANMNESCHQIIGS